MQQCVYKMKFRNVCEVKKRLVQPGSVWSRILSILLSMNGESISLLVFTWYANTSSSFTAGSWKMNNWMTWNASQSVRNVNKMCNHIAFDKKSDISLVVFSPGNAETDVWWGGKLISHLIASCVKNIRTKNYQNVIIGFQVTVENVGDVFGGDTVYGATGPSQSWFD